MRLACLLLLFAVLPSTLHALDADIVIRGALLVDGTGKPAKKGDLAIRGERIVGVGSFDADGNYHEIDGSGLVVAPGFIDLHTHSDRKLLEPITRQNLCYLYQGVSTVVTGNCGAGPVNVQDYFKKLEEGGIGTNVIHQMPHNAVRNQVMGNANREPSKAELAKMQDLIDKGMQAGAFGMSTGLIYNPGTYAKTDEIIALAKVVGKHKGHYASHIRNEGANVVFATTEAIRIGKEAGVPVHISHMKASGRANWGKVGDTIGLITDAREAGQMVTADQYPYSASSTSLFATLVDSRYREGNYKDFLARLKDADLGPKIRVSIADELKARDDGQAIQIATYKPNRTWQGKRISEIAKLTEKTPLEVSLEILEKGGAQIVNFSMSPEDVRLIMRQPFVATASDGSSQNPKDETVPHPRSYGCYPRKIGFYALQDKIITLEHAVRSASGLPADILRLRDRGYLEKGAYADVVVFDPKTFRDQATFEKPHQFSTGVRYLLVNGKFAIEEGKATDQLPGKVLRWKP